MHDDIAKELVHAISKLNFEIHELRTGTSSIVAFSKSLATIDCKLTDLEKKTEQIMSKISDFAAAQSAFNDRIDTAVSGLTSDIEALNKKITDLQNSAGQITPEDQKLLDDIQARASGIADKLDALDALTPPVVPTDDGGGTVPPGTPSGPTVRR